MHLKDQLKTISDIETTLQNLNNSIQTVVSDAKPRCLANRMADENTTNLKEKIAQKQRLRKHWHPTRNPVDRTN